MPIIEIPTSSISDWRTFHDVFAQTLGFPEFYGRNMDAWIDCLTYRDDDDGLSDIIVQGGDVLTLQLDEGTTFRNRCPDLHDAIVDGVAVVNLRRIEGGMRPIVALAYR